MTITELYLELSKYTTVFPSAYFDNELNQLEIELLAYGFGKSNHITIRKTKQGVGFNVLARYNEETYIQDITELSPIIKRWAYGEYETSVLNNWKLYFDTFFK